MNLFLLLKPILLRARETQRLQKLSEAQFKGEKVLRCGYGQCAWAIVGTGASSQRSLGQHYRNCVSYAQHQASRRDAGSSDSSWSDGIAMGDLAEDEGGAALEDDVVYEQYEDYVVAVGTLRDDVVDPPRRSDAAEILAQQTHTDVLDGFDFNANPNILSSESSASYEILSHQQKVEGVIDNPLPDLRKEKSSGANVDLYQLGAHLNLSDRKGDLLLSYLERYSSEGFFSKWKDLRQAFQRQFKATRPFSLGAV